MKRTFIMLAVSSSLLAAISGAVAQHTVVTDQELMDKLRDAAPAAVLKGAAILNMGADGHPFATEETRDNNWIKTGSHVMIVGAEAKSMMQGYPRDAKPDPTKPYVMWPGTPYEHLMLPVK